MTSISNEIESSLLSLEKKMEETSQVVETQQKEILFQIIKEKHREQYIRSQRRIEALRSPLANALGVLQSIFGEEQQKDEEKREIDTSVLDEDFETTSKYLDHMNYEEVLEFFHYFSRMGLKRANNKWAKRRQEENWEKYKL